MTVLPRHPADRLSLTVVAVHFGLIGWWIGTSFATVDEACHLGSGLATWKTGDTRPYCVNPPLPRLIATIPVWSLGADVPPATQGLPGDRPEGPLAGSLARENPGRYVSLVRAARVANLVWPVLLLAVLCRWSGELYGPWGRLIVVALWCLEPSAIAFSGTVVPDVPAAAAGLLASYLFWRYLCSPGWGMAWFAGLALGLALSTKLTVLILLAVWPTLLLMARISRLGHQTRLSSGAGLNLGSRSRQSSGEALDPRSGDFGYPGSHAKPRFCHLLVVGIATWLIVCLGYGLTKMGRPLGEFQFVSKALGGQWESIPDGSLRNQVPGNRFHDTALARVPVPLPADLIIGIDIQKQDFERGLYSYLDGQWQTHGWWYYYLYAMALKLPLPTLILVLAGVFWCLWAPRSSGRVDELAFFLPAVVLIALVSSQTGFNHHMRYVLPAFPLLFLAAGRLAGLAEQRKWLRGVIAALLVWCATATVSVAPYFMSYFNPLGGGPEGGWRHLENSNIDWGQDLLHLKKWLADHPEARPIGVQYYNFLEPDVVGIEAGRVPREPTPGWYALDVSYVAGSTFLVGTQAGAPTPGPYWYFQKFTPVAKAGYSIFIYHVTPEEANRARAEMGLLPWKDAQP